MSEIINAIMKGEYLVVIIFLITILTISLAKQILGNISYFHQYFSNRENNNIKELIQLREETKDGNIKNLINDKIDEYIFRKCTGIAKKKKTINFIFSLSKKLDIELHHFEKSTRFYKLKNGKFELKITQWDKIGKYIDYTAITTLFLLTVFIILLNLIYEHITFPQRIVTFILAILLMLFSIYIFHQGKPLKSAMLIKNKLENNK